MRICFYEDAVFDQFYPLTYMRPVYTLRSGIVPMFKRAERYFNDAELCFAARTQVSPRLAERHRDMPVNIIKKSEDGVLLLNGRVRDYGDLSQLISASEGSCVFTHENETVAVLFKRGLLKLAPSVATQREYQELLEAESADVTTRETTASLYNYCWEIMADIGGEITTDFLRLKDALTHKNEMPSRVFIVNPENIIVEPGVRVAQGALLDASEGPIYIGGNSRVDTQSAIHGPCYIGPNSVVVAGKIVASSIGHTCRVGGEVEESIFHSYVNKYHAGFIGHSYVGPWVNFGAMTTNSDLKNNYSNIRVSVGGKMIDTGSIKVGSFIGDHTKFGIGTLLNTGINIGVSCNLFGGALIADKEVPSFSWGTSGAYQRYDIEKAIETATTSAERRNHKLSDREIELLRKLSDDINEDDGVVGF
ncbi:MAG: putative sugar nucleotidyl transferase [candidate division Zixibacteria bacterium]|nr:putative sugar nucleotidyl transferase [candidate division Zixibacteria bacterium]MDH3937916.1 putative sugar nucleotidyl transferase [candidate division Zixibacteria bacterium]MDH4034924.1 putative sugar nucleotidyl transferase [candidate division Zixibacteria bacterium]